MLVTQYTQTHLDGMINWRLRQSELSNIWQTLKRHTNGILINFKTHVRSFVFTIFKCFPFICVCVCVCHWTRFRSNRSDRLIGAIWSIGYMCDWEPFRWPNHWLYGTVGWYIIGYIYKWIKKWKPNSTQSSIVIGGSKCQVIYYCVRSDS